MNLLDQITVLVLTWNEEANIGRTLDALRRFAHVVVLDSGSTDGTQAIAARHANVRWHTRPFDNHAAQWNHGLRECGIDTPWVLALDADYLLPAAAVDEIAALQPDASTSGFRAAFTYCIDGQPLRGSLYPPVTVLFRRERATYRQDGHTQRLVLDGAVQDLRTRVLHDDRKPLTAWLAAQARYAELEAPLIRQRRWADLAWPDRLRRLILVTPWLVPLYCLLWRQGWRDGRAGLQYALQRSIAESMIALALLRATPPNGGDGA